MACKRSSVQVRYPPWLGVHNYPRKQCFPPCFLGFLCFLATVCVILAVPLFVPHLGPTVPLFVPLS